MTRVDEQDQERPSGPIAPTPDDFGFGQLFWSIRDAVVVGDVTTGRIVLWNPAAEDLFGLPMEQAIGRSIETLIPEALREQHRVGLFHYQQTGGGALIDAGQPVEVPALRATGEPITIELHLTPVVGSRVPGPFVVATIRDVTARKQAEQDRLELARAQSARAAAEQAAESLRQSEAQFRTAFDYAPIGMDLVGLDGRFLRVNAALCAMLGYTEAELLTMTFVDITHPDDLDQDLAKLSRLFVGEIPALQVEKRYLRKDGTVLWARINTSLLHDQHGAPRHYISQIEDITARIQSEAARAQLAAIVEAAEDGILSCSPDGTILSWNRGAERLFGYRAEEAIGQSVAMLRPPDLVNDIAEVMARVRQGESIEGHETVRLTRDGRRITISLSLTPMRDVHGEIVAIASISRDMTALREAEAAARLRNRAMAAASNGMIITDPTLPDHPIVDVNPAFEIITGYPRDEAIGRNCRFLQGPDSDPATLRRLKLAIAEGREMTETVRNYRQDGTPFWNELRIAPVRDATGVLTHFVGIQTDVTERMAADVALHDAVAHAQASAEAKERFLTMMSHELRTPLQSVLGYVEFLLQGPQDAFTRERREDLEAIQRGATRMVTLIEQTLELSRMNAGQVVLERTSVDLNSLLHQIGQDLAPQADAKGITLQIDRSEIPPIEGDLGRVYQILLNLAANAVKFTPSGEVRLTAGPTDMGVAVAVHDTGIGMDAETLQNIFEEYYQGGGGLGYHSGGTGLGRAIVSRLAHEMGGRITVESEVGRGSCLTLHLPLMPPSTLLSPA